MTFVTPSRANCQNLPQSMKLSHSISQCISPHQGVSLPPAAPRRQCQTTESHRPAESGVCRGHGMGVCRHRTHWCPQQTRSHGVLTRHREFRPSLLQEGGVTAVGKTIRSSADLSQWSEEFSCVVQKSISTNTKKRCQLMY